MTRAFRESVTIEQDGLIEIHHPDLAAGTRAEVIVLVDQPSAGPAPLASFVGKGKGCFTDAGEVDTFLRSERDSWDR